MLTLANYLHDRLEVWRPQDGSEVKRLFLYSEEFVRELNQLSDERGTGMTRKPTPRAGLIRLIDAFVRGDAPGQLVRPKNEGMGETFVRMRPPNAGIVEMRTAPTRTFGFFAEPNVFVALSVKSTDFMKSPDEEGLSIDRYKPIAREINAYIAILPFDNVDLRETNDLVTKISK